ncbi:MAG: MATE family efflux transporter [Anaeromyxobacter sp.]
MKQLRSEMAALSRLALPLALAQAGQALMGIVDAAVVGRAGAGALAAVGLGTTFTMTLAVTGMGVMQGLDPLISQAVGAGDRAGARRLLWQGLWLALGVGAALTLPFLFIPRVLVPLGIDPALAGPAGDYFLWRLPGLPAFFAYMAARAYLQGLGLGRPMVVATVLANVANLLLDVLLVYGGAGLPAWAGPLRLVPSLGATGAAIATTLCTVLQLLVLAFAIRAADPGVAPPSRRPDPRVLGAALRVGWPVGVHLGAEVGIFALVGFLAGRLGALPMAAHQLAISVASFTFTFAVGFGQAGSVRVGWAVGARDRAAARRAGLAAFASGVLFMTCAALAFLLFPEAIAGAFSNDPDVIALASRLLAVAAVFQLFDGLQGVGAGVLRGAGETHFTLVANLFGHWLLGFPATLALGFWMGMGVIGLWWGFVLGLGTVGLLLVGRFLVVSSREIRPLEAGLQ